MCSFAYLGSCSCHSFLDLHSWPRLCANHGPRCSPQFIGMMNMHLPTEAEMPFSINRRTMLIVAVQWLPNA